MKKFFTLVVMAMTSLAMMAKDYTCPLVVSLSGLDFPPIEGVTVSVDEQINGKYTLKLLNFDMGGAMPVGNIVVEDVDAVTCGTTIVLRAQKNITITEGDKELGEDQSWLGPKLGIVPINMQGELKGDKFNAILNIDGNSVENEDIAADKTLDKELSPEDKDDGPANKDRKPSILDKIKNIKTEQNSKDTPKSPEKSKDEEIG